MHLGFVHGAVSLRGLLSGLRFIKMFNGSLLRHLLTVRFEATSMTSRASRNIHTPTRYAPFLFEGRRRDSITAYPTRLLKLSADSENLRIGKMIHAQLIASNENSRSSIVEANSLIDLYSKCGQMSSARKLFDDMRERNEVSWGALMAGYLRSGSPSEVIQLFKCMLSLDCVPPNEYILATVVSSCSEYRRGDEGKQCHGYVVKSGLEFHQYVKNALLNMYLRCWDVKAGIMVLDTLPGYDIFTYNLVLNGLMENGNLMEALGVLARMVVDRAAWDGATYCTALGLCASLKDLKLGLSLHCRMLKSRVDCDDFFCSTLIDMYGKCGKVMNASKVFSSLPIRNVVTWTAVMTAYFQNGFFEEALNLLPEMENECVPANDYTFVVLLNCCAALSALRHGYLLHALVQKSGFKNHTNVGNALINMYSKSGDIEASYEVFSNTVLRDFATWNSMICGYSQHGLGREALSVFGEMMAARELPSYVTFVGVLSACAHLGLEQEALFYLNHLMRHYGIEPGVEHYTCIIRLLTKAGSLDKAENFMKSTPVQWDTVAWRTLLNACHVHRQYGLGQRVAEIVIRMDATDVGTYILASNMYAKAKRWDGVVNIRKLMKERSIKKEPGVSWIEIKDTTHVFVSDDNSHPEYLKIYEKVGELLAKIKDLGYVPDIGGVLHDVEDEQKEDYLSYHSEKLAIAYGLLKTPSEAPLRVIKNLRMCDDCHSAVKLIAKVTKRVIIVRDVNRFHHFREGLCSCGDHW